MEYIGLIHKEARSDFGVSFPDFPGVVTAGRTLDEARAMAEEALAFHIDGLLEDGEDIPEPSGLEAIMRDRDNRTAAIMVIQVARRRGKARRVDITLPEDVLERIDAYAENHGLTRSAFLARVATRALVSPVTERGWISRKSKKGGTKRNLKGRIKKYQK